MSTLVTAVLGNIQGKVGNVVGRKFRNEYVVAAYQPKVRNPRTTAQQLIRARLGALSQLSNSMASAINNGLRNAAKGSKWSPRNLFVKLNFEAVHAASPDSVSIDYTDIVLSKGTVNNPHFGAPQFDNPLQVGMTCSLDGMPNGYQSYEVETFLYAPDLRIGIKKQTRFQAASGLITVDVPASWNGTKVHVWCWTRFIGNTDVENALYEGAVSNSAYCGSGNIN